MNRGQSIAGIIGTIAGLFGLMGIGVGATQYVGAIKQDIAVQDIRIFTLEKTVKEQTADLKFIRDIVTALGARQGIFIASTSPDNLYR